MATYKIKKGDNLTKIAKQYGTTINALTKANNISNPNSIIAGNMIKIPNAIGNEKPSKIPNYNQNNKPKQTLLNTDPTKPVYSPTKSYNNALNTLNQTEKQKPGPYTQSDNLTGIYNDLLKYEQNKPGAYQSGYAEQINSLLSQIQNRPDFKYNMNADPLYQQYKDQYINAGNLAMQDTMGNAAALTGGYGSSYATTAGNQAYQSNLQQLNNVIPELYNAAYSRYSNEGNDLMNQLSMLQNQDQLAYGQYRDNVNDYYTDLNYNYNKYNNMSDQEYNRYQNDLGAWQSDRDYYFNRSSSQYQNDYNQYLNKLGNWENDRSFEYQKQQDALAQQNYLAEMAYQREKDRIAQANRDRDYALRKSKLSNKNKNTLKGANKQKNNIYINEINDLAMKQGGNAAVERVNTLYNAGKIDEQEAKDLLMVSDIGNTANNLFHVDRKIPENAITINDVGNYFGNLLGTKKQTTKKKK